MDLQKSKIAIIGLGLMGGSLAIALKKRYPEASIYGISRNKKTLQAAKKKKLIDVASTNLEKVLVSTDIDLFVIATPVQVIKDVLLTINRYAKNNPIVTDLGSTKYEIVTLAEKKSFQKISFVGSHPMTGSHNVGFAYANPDLYTKALCFITQTSRTKKVAVAVIEKLWKDLDVKTVIVKPALHDKVVSRISHLPHAVAFALVDTVARYGDDGFKFAGGGFRDFTRIAASDPKMWVDIFESNKKNILRDLHAFKNAIDSLIAKVEDEDTRHLFSFLEKISHKRRNL